MERIFATADFFEAFRCQRLLVFVRDQGLGIKMDENGSKCLKADDRTRTDDIQLGKLTFYH